MKPQPFFPSIALLVVAALAVPQTIAVGQNKSKLRTTYDAFADRTSIATKELQIISGGSVNVTLIASFSYPGQHYKKPESVTLLFIVLADNWLFLDPPTVRALIGTEHGITDRLVLGTPTITTQKVLIGRYVRTREALNLKIPTADFIKLANAERVQMQMRTGLEFEVEGSDLQQLKSLAAQLRP